MATKTTKKVTEKTASPRRRTVTKKEEITPDVTTKEQKTLKNLKLRVPSFSFRKLPKSVSLFIGLLVILGLLYLARSLFIVAVVNGQPIDRFTFTNELQKQGGKKVLTDMVTKTLILQEANKKHITVSDKEVDAQMKKIEENVKQQGQDLDQLLAAQGMTRNDLREQIKIQKIVEKILADKIKVSDQEVTAYIEKNKANFPAGTTDAQMKAQATQQLQQTKLSSAYQTWIADLEKNAKIIDFVNF